MQCDQYKNVQRGDLENLESYNDFTKKSKGVMSDDLAGHSIAL